MIEPARFLVRSVEQERWHATRRTGVTATEVAGAATPAGFEAAIEERLFPTPTFQNDYMTFGTAAEAEIMRHAHHEFGLLPSDWLLAGQNPRHMATPDGLSLDHTEIAEAKTTGTDWATPPIKYRRQIQFQLHVTGAARCLLLWNLRIPDNNGWYYLGWIEPKTLWLDRDEKMIAELEATANRLMEKTDGR